MNIVFRADSSSTIGTGHIMRDLVLAQRYENKGHSIIFATQDLQGNMNHKIIEAGYELNILKSNDIEELDELIKKLKIDMIVIDHYGIDYDFEKKLKIKNPTLKILSFDDTYEKHYCDILLNHNISADKKRYKNLVPKRCKLRCGSKYILLRDEFIKEKKKLKSKKPSKKFKIFIAMGGADTANLNIKILHVLKKYKNIKVHLVTTLANQNLKELEKYCKDKKWIKLHINSDKIAKLMAKSSFAIISPSVTANEAFFMELPFIAIKTADNQNDMYKYLKQKKFFVLKEFDSNKLLVRINKLSLGLLI
jgi:UDP-2,4-diacetamido-2,4,6-trideoxy-beta-L-altropyranose hydrolase